MASCFSTFWGRFALAVATLSVSAAACIAAPVALAGDGAAKGAPSMQVAQADYNLCRDVFGFRGKVFKPKHPRADEYGCVSRRHLGADRKSSPRRPRRPDVRNGRVVEGRALTFVSDWVRPGRYGAVVFQHGLGVVPHHVSVQARRGPGAPVVFVSPQYAQGYVVYGGLATVQAGRRRVTLLIPQVIKNIATDKRGYLVFGQTELRVVASATVQ